MAKHRLAETTGAIWEGGNEGTAHLIHKEGGERGYTTPDSQRVLLDALLPPLSAVLGLQLACCQSSPERGKRLKDVRCLCAALNPNPETLNRCGAILTSAHEIAHERSSAAQVYQTEHTHTHIYIYPLSYTYPTLQIPPLYTRDHALGLGFNPSTWYAGERTSYPYEHLYEHL